jgi:hypothetical protein
VQQLQNVFRRLLIGRDAVGGHWDDLVEVSEGAGSAWP